MIDIPKKCVNIVWTCEAPVCFFHMTKPVSQKKAQLRCTFAHYILAKAVAPATNLWHKFIISGIIILKIK